MIITIHQPEHLPWLGFFNKLSKAELFVILDHVQFEKNYFQNRNQIIGTNGVQYIGIPTVASGRMAGSIQTTEIALEAKPNWKNKYINTIKLSYSKYPFFDEVFPILEQTLSIDTKYICDINIAIIKAFADKLGFYPQYVRSSELDIRGSKSELILNICKKVGATTYIAGPSGRDYLDLDSFKVNNIKVVFNDYTHPVYQQMKSKDFVPYMSSLDLFMNCGFREGRKIIIEGNEEFYNN